MDPVIVVGAGPVGLALSLCLATQGVPAVVLDEGAGKDDPRPARTAVLRPDTAALMVRLGCSTLRDEGARWVGWRQLRRKQQMRQLRLGDAAESGGASGTSGPDGDGAERGGPSLPSPLHLPQHALTRGLRDAVARHDLVRLVPDSRLDSLEQDARGVTVHTRGPGATWWRGSHVVGCDGARSTVRKLLGVRFPGRTAVERHAVAALRVELPWPGEAVLHRQPPWRSGGQEVSARPLTDGVWRLDWLLPARGELVTPEALVARVRDTLTGWCGDTPPYDLLDTGVYTLHHRLARRWRVGRAFLAGDAAHLLGALGTQGLDEGLRDADNLGWKLAHAWHHGASDTLLDSYQAERRTAVAARLRAADQSLTILRGGGGLRTYLPGTARGHDTLLADGHLGQGPMGAPPAYPHSPLAPPYAEAHATVDTRTGAPVDDVLVTAPDGMTVRLRDRLGRGRVLVVLVAPGTGVWDRRHWLTAGVMPRLAEAVAALPSPAELLVTESYPGASAHSVLLVRPDGHLVAAFGGVRPDELYAAADAARGGAPEASPAPDRPGGRDRTANIN
ncbi:3-(3-hydroxy-phenyl)propionate/3-hydroxycinnamic acid hydroxylase [Streptomyces sp. S4.7]|uniref:FAD-dependent monooxygenase n=1 Tax=Streptomyces sp. S4.7 TaxID=2705439 RepID=UPI001398A96B|nr:FAD-dependent monooxygenase [Streptomyces sp. S4.7]QHY98572.1 3-(3-hydroxy-phenyl)propionate/3-hydroxycinnamic acid hydroxylase [Streptomyces sp. S4.7]